MLIQRTMSPNSSDQELLEDVATAVALLSSVLSRLQLRVDHDAQVDDTDLLSTSSVESSIGPNVRVKILSGPGKGKKGRVTKKHGEKFWWVKLDDGRKLYKMPHLLCVLDQDE